MNRKWNAFCILNNWTIYFNKTIRLAVPDCLRIRQFTPAGDVLGLPGYRFFKVLPEDIPDVHTWVENGSILPVLGPLIVAAKDNYIIGWMRNDILHAIYNSKGQKIMKCISSGTTHVMRYQNDKQVHPTKRIEQAIRDRSRSPLDRSRGGKY